MKKLIGKTIKNIYLKDEDNLAFETSDLAFETSDEELFFYYTDADCCSFSWIEHISGIENLLNHEILEVDKIDLVDLNIDNDGESIQVYGVKVKTTKGYFDIEFRNSSNGYYGGSLEEITDDIKNGFKVLSEDF